MNKRLFGAAAGIVAAALVLVIILATGTMRGNAQPRLLTLMTFNTQWLFDTVDDPAVMTDQDHMPADLNAKMSALSQVIRAHNPDVLALQEVENRQILDQFNTQFLAGLGYTVYWFDSADTITGQDVALLTRLQPVGQMLDHLRDATNLHGRRWRISKGVLDLRLQVTGNDETLHVFITHLKSQLPSEVDGYSSAYNADWQRAGQGKLVREIIGPALEAGENVVVMGDLNDGPNSPPLEFIEGQNGPGPKLCDPLSAVPLAENYTYTYEDDSRDIYYQRIDHILISKNLRGHVASVGIEHNVPAVGSDHNPPYLTLQF